jgi:hypothetical protein
MAEYKELLIEAKEFAESINKEPNALYGIAKEIERALIDPEFTADPGYIREKVNSAKTTLDWIEKDVTNAYKIRENLKG